MSRRQSNPAITIAEQRNVAEAAVLEFDQANRPSRVRQLGQAAMDRLTDKTTAASDIIQAAKAEISYTKYSWLAKLDQRSKQAMPNLRESYSERHGYAAVPSKPRFIGLVATRFIGKNAEPKAAQAQSKYYRLQEELENHQNGGRLAKKARAYQQKVATEAANYRAERSQVWNETIAGFREETNVAAAWQELKQQRQAVIDSFITKDISKLAATIPSGEDYADLAKKTMHHLIDRSKNPDHITTIFNNATTVQEVRRTKVGDAIQFKDDQIDALGDVSTMLWKMGFVEFANEQAPATGRGAISPAAERHEGEDFVSYRLPFNRENELHKMLSPTAVDGAMIHLEMPAAADNFDPSMFMYVAAA